MDTFTNITNLKLGEMIKAAKERIIYAAPGIFLEVALALTNFSASHGEENLDIVLDADPEVCRLGYGEISAIELLIKNGINIRKTDGLRIGIILVDDNAWIYSPTPLVVEEEPNSIRPNAVAVGIEQASALINSISPKLTEQLYNAKGQKSLHLVPKIKEPEIGNVELNKQDFVKAKTSLEERPPQKFDLSRRVTVYHGYVQFVDLNLTGCHLGRHTVSIPPKLLNVTRDKQVQERMKAAYKLISKDSKLTGKEIDGEVARIRKKYLCSLKRFGTVILRKNKDEFLKEVESIRNSLKKFADKVELQLDREFEKCRKELIKILLPVVKENPPDDLRRSITTAKPSEKIAKLYLEDSLKGVIPNANSFIKEMKLNCDFKDVTYEMLKDVDFQTELKNKFPFIEWPEPFEEYKAVREKKQ